MKPRTKFMIGGALVLGAAGYLMASSIRATGEYYLTPTELAPNSRPIRRSPTSASRSVPVWCRDPCSATPGGKRVRVPRHGRQPNDPVVYRGIAPDTFTDSVDVVVGGRMGTDGTFHATELLAKCASRYENAPTRSTARRRATRRPSEDGRSRVILIGELSLWVALLMAAWSTTVSFAGGGRGAPTSPTAASAASTRRSP